MSKTPRLNAVIDQLMLDQITNDHLGLIFESSDHFSNLTSESQLEIRFFLAGLKVRASVSHRMNALGRRSILDKQLRALNTAANALADCLERLSAEPLHVSLACVASDLLESKLVSQPKQAFKFIAFDEILASLRLPLGRLQEFVSHLQSLIMEFDELTEAEQGRWFETGKTQHQRTARLGLYPYLRKSSSGADAVVLQCIEALYKHVYAKQFSVYPRSASAIEKEKGARLIKASTPQLQSRLTNGSRSDASDFNAREIALYDGPGLDFACRVIQTLGLGGLLVKLTKASVAKHYRTPNHRRKQQDMSKLDFEDLNRNQAFGRTVDAVVLKNKIGRLWTAEKARRRTSEQSKALPASSNSSKKRRPRKKQLRPRNGST